MNRRYTTYITIISLIAFAVVFYSTYTTFTSSPLSSTPAPTQQTSRSTPVSEPAAVPAANITVRVENAEYATRVSEGTSVLSIMHTLASSTNLTFTGREYPSLGFFIESINGKKNGNGYYWFLYVNGTSSETGVSQTNVHPGDRIEWRYKKSD